MLTVMESITLHDPSDWISCAAGEDCPMNDYKLQDYNKSYNRAASNIRKSVQELKLCKPGL